MIYSRFMHEKILRAKGREKEKSISYRLAFIVLTIGLALTLITSAIQGLLEYRINEQDMREDIFQIENSYLQPIATSVFKVDYEQVELLLAGAVNLKYIAYMAFTEHRQDKVVTIEKGDSESNGLTLKNYELKHQTEISDRVYNLGQITVGVNTNLLMTQFTNSIFKILVTKGLEILVISIVLLIIIQRTVTTHLKKMADYSRSYNIKSLDQILSIRKKNRKNNRKQRAQNELDHLCNAINTMRTNIKNDFIEKEQYLNEVKSLRNFLDNVIENLPSGLILLNRSDEILYWNKLIETITNIPKKAVVGQRIQEILPGESDITVKIMESVQSREHQFIEKAEYHHKGRITVVDIFVYPVTTGTDQGTVIIVNDMTEKVHMENYIVQSEKLRTIGSLTAGIAHEINNPLAGILQNVQVLINRLNVDFPRNREHFDRLKIDSEAFYQYLMNRNIPKFLSGIQNSGKRAVMIVREMLTFSRKSESKLQPESIPAIMDEAIHFASNDFDSKSKYDFKLIEIRKSYQTDLPQVECDKNKILQVLLNLLKNASQALFESPKSQKILSISIDASDTFITIEILDNGIGMTESVRKSLFEPFFTTKKEGSGTGLGLSISSYIITDIHKGQIEVESELDVGTKMTITLPVVETIKETSARSRK